MRPPEAPRRTRTPSRAAFILPADIWLRLRRTAAVVFTSTALTLLPGPQAARATSAAPIRQPPPSAVIFDRSYATKPVWESLGLSPGSAQWSPEPSSRLPPFAPEHPYGRSPHQRQPEPNALLSSTKRIRLVDEVRILWRLLVALTVGGIIGVERRAARSFAGVRTFSLVSLGAAVFMSTALVAFPNADPARVAAAISSSVGFLGAGVMSKNNQHSRGLTTASSVWLAAALGIAAASGLFILSYSGAILTVLIARYARFDSSLQLIHPADRDAAFRDEDDGVDEGGVEEYEMDERELESLKELRSRQLQTRIQTMD